MHRRLLLLARETRTGLVITVLSGVATGLLIIGQSYALSRTVSDVFTLGRTLAQVWPWMQALLVIVLARAASVWINEVAAGGIAVGIKTQVREQLFAHILQLGPAYVAGERTGELTTAAVEGVEALDAYFSQYLPQLIISALVPAAILFVVFPLDPLSGVVLLLTAPLIPFFMHMIGRGAELVTKRQYETLRRLSAHFLDSLQGLTTLKLFGQSKAQARNIARAGDEYRDATLKVLQVTFLSALALELLATVSTAIIAVEVGLRLLYGRMYFQEALFLLILAPEFYLPLRMLGLRFHAGMAGTTAARRIFEVLDTRIEVEEPKAPNSQTDPKDLLSRKPFSGLELSDVSYAYPAASSPALRNLSFQVRAGQHIALVGPSGAGKTTLARILLRFMEPSQGKLVLDGTPACEWPPEEWRCQFAWVPQSPHLFHDTIAANLRVGNPTASDEQVAAAARAAHLDEFIDSLPARFESQIGEAGARLSSGQAQRLALARAFLKDSPILLLDEPTSSLDPETEALLEESTHRLMQGRTVITIAHRLNTVLNADQILVLQAGALIETGTHLELLAKHGLYANTVMTQQPASSIAGVESEHNSRNDVQDSALAQATVLPASKEAELGAATGEGSSASATQVLLRLLGFLRGSWGWVALSILLGSLTIGSSVALLGISSWLISSAALRPSIAVLEVAIVGVRFFGITRGVLRYLERLVSHNVTFRLLGRLRAWFYECLEPLAPARLLEYRAGDLLARIVGDVGTLENFYVRVVAPPATALIVGIAAASFLATGDTRLAVVLIAAFLLLGVGLPLLANFLSRRTGPHLVTQRAEMSALLVDGIQGLPDILAFGQGPHRIIQLRNIGNRNGNTQRQAACVSALNSALATLVTNIAPWIVLGMAIPQVGSGQIAGVMLAPLVLVMLSSFEAVSPLPFAAQAWSSSLAAARRLFEVVDSPPAVEELAEPGRTTSASLSGASSLLLAGVSFTYPGQRAPALHDVSLALESGQKLAIVGPSGAGKSTLVNLLLRFWEFDSGEMSLNGRPLRLYPPDEVRSQFALVSPNTYFFNTSIYENLRMARRGVSRHEVERAAEDAAIHDFIAGLPNGYDTLIGEQGMRLSGGERQRLAIARAILKRAPILILDEPTANLDALVESEVLSTLFRLMEGRASLLITHRLVGLERMDAILVMDDGQIVQRGSHVSLSSQLGCYRRLWELQNRFLPEPARKVNEPCNDGTKVL